MIRAWLRPSRLAWPTIAIAGISVPAAVGTALVLFFRAGIQYAVIGACLALFGLIATVVVTHSRVRWLNRRDDSRQAKRPIDPP